MPTGERGEPLEIERKFLICRPEEARLRSESVRRIEITQVYLTRGPEGENRRVRRSREAGEERLFYTEKLRLSGQTRIEREREIDGAEYARLLRESDPERRPVEKVRWCVPFGGHVLEIDVFPFWRRQAYCEAEMEREGETVELPPWIRVIREVTEDERYTNSALALEIPPEG